MEYPKVQHRPAEIHLAKIGKLDRGEQLLDELPAVQTDDQASQNTSPPVPEVQDTLPSIKAECAFQNSTPSVR